MMPETNSGASSVRDYVWQVLWNLHVSGGDGVAENIGDVPGWPGAHTQAADLDELQRNLREVIEMLLEDGEPKLESEFLEVRTVQVA
jgi:hypothetical protein